MANFSARIFGSSLSSLRAQLARIAVVSNNIANADTAGYSRRTVNITTGSQSNVGQIQVGSGVEIGSVVRITNEFFFNNMISETARHNFFNGQMELISSLDNFFGAKGLGTQLGIRLTEFFQSAQEISTNPSSPALRRAFIEKGQLLAENIRLLYKSLAKLQSDANGLISQKVDQVNLITKQIAELNTKIKAFESQNGHGSALDLRDQRDKLLNDLAKHIEYDFFEGSDFTVTISLKNGLTLVSGSESWKLKALTNPSFTTNTTYALDGSALSYVVVELGFNSHVDVSEVLKNSGGDIGGLLSFRGLADPAIINPFNVDGIIVSVARKIEALSRFFLTTVNQIYRGWDPSLPFNGDEDPGTTYFDPSSIDLNGFTPGVYGLFGLTGVTLSDTNNDGLPNDLGSLTVFSTADRLRFLVSDPNNLAFSRDLDPTAGSLVGAPGDSRIASQIANLRYQITNFTAPGFTYSGRPTDLVELTQTEIGTIVREIKENHTSSLNRMNFFSQQLDSVRGVNSDEELALLTQFQRYYQYSARLLSVADDLLSEILKVL
ncbi:MAG: flagellar hook-associated protein FlgK [Deltaproteobacteria bacterium]|nr:flagellar hook-associated protein FlgK [Deltaproteobacteria bacterium]MCX7952874.1 flagellar hook-associated protein FlgK [Deltaproteobacteria bacterium]